MRVRAAVAPVHAEPRVAAPQVSQLLAGHEVHVLTEDGDWRRVRGADGYEGWVHRGYLEEGTSEADRMSLGCVVDGGAGAAGWPATLPFGALLAPAQRVTGGDAVALADRGSRFPPRGDGIVESAVRWFRGTSYQWGGVTPWGADCSGMTQSVFRLHGVSLPRDAWQQADACAPCDALPERAPAGALLFFSDRPDRRITHVGIAAGDGGMVHVALGRGGWARERFDAATDDAYARALRERFLFARLAPGVG